MVSCAFSSVISRSSLRRSCVLSSALKTYSNPSVLIATASQTTTFSQSISSSTRFFSSKESKDAVQEETAESASIGSKMLSKVISPTNQRYFAIAGGTLGTLVVAQGFLSFTKFFVHMPPTTVAKYGFYTGFSTAGVMATLGLFTYDTITIRADPVFRYCFAQISCDPVVQKHIGDGMVHGNLRSYRLDAGRFEATSVKSATWRDPRIQMIFDVKGLGPPYRTGLVTCEAVKKSGSFPPKLVTTILKVDYEDGDEGEGGDVEGDKSIWLRGDEEAYNRVSRRSGLSLSTLAQNIHINRAAARK